MTTRELLERLQRVRHLNGGWQARCPAHEDKNPSLSVTESDGKILLRCHAGCETSAIVSAMGLGMADLYSDPKPNRNGTGKKIAATYDYTDESSKLLYQVVRYAPKDFRQRRPDGKGGWIWSLDGTRPVLYQLPKVLGTKWILVLEGEKDVDAAWKLRLPATCNPRGAGKWKAEYSEALRGKHVVVVCDADAPGLDHGRHVARSLLGMAASVRMIEALPQGKDLSEWLERGGTRDALREMIRRTPELMRGDVAEWQAAKPANANGFTLTRLGDLMREAEERVSWILDGILPSGGLGLLAAKPKTGKSTLARCLALAVARGDPFLGRSTFRGAVIYLALEEKRSEVRGHFRAMGATGEEEIFIHAANAPLDALASITVEVKRHKPVLLIIDPALRFVRVKDGNDYAQVSAALEPILALARENGCHTLLVHHLGKGERSEATDAILGSTALFAAVDSALVMKRYEKYRTLQSSQRYGEDLSETELKFDSARRVLSLGIEKSKVDSETVGAEILQFLAGKEPMTEEQILAEVEGKQKTKRAALRDFHNAGKIMRTGGGKKGNPFLYAVPKEPQQESKKGIPEKCSDSRTQYITGTRVRESEKVTETRMNTGRIPVPENSGKPILVPANGEARETPLSQPGDGAGLPLETGSDRMEI